MEADNIHVLSVWHVLSALHKGSYCCLNDDTVVLYTYKSHTHTMLLAIGVQSIPGLGLKHKL